MSVLGAPHLPPGMRDLFDGMSDALLVIDRRSRVSFVNTAALRLLGVEAGTPSERLAPLIGEPAAQWVSMASRGRSANVAPPAAALADGRQARLAWHALGGGHHCLRVAVEADATSMQADRRLPAPARAPRALGDAVSGLWEAPVPCMLQDARFFILDVNPAFLALTGHARDRLIGVDPVQLQPAADRPTQLAERRRMAAALVAGESPLIEHRLIDAQGRERWVRASPRALVDVHGQQVVLTVLLDCTAEHVAHERAERAANELDDWFALSPVGMLLFDETGLLIRANASCAALAGALPALLSEADPTLRQLLGWTAQGAAADLQPGAVPRVSEGWLVRSDGQRRRLRATVRCHVTASGQRRIMAVLEDRSLEEERDLAELQVGVLMDTAGVGLATFAESSGWVRQRAGSGGESAATAAALQSISRDIVEPASLPAYEQLQTALRHGQSAEVRYAIRHPTLGLRWLLTRVRPATLASGERTASVMTQDITDQHRAQQRSDELLHELKTILNSTTAGIAYIRGQMLVRCNRRFESMLGLRGGDLPGRSVQDLFHAHPLAQRIAAETLHALASAAVYETEFAVPGRPGPDGTARPGQWYALSVRRTGRPSHQVEAIAVVSDITRLKTQQAELEILARDRELMFSLSGIGIAFVRNRTIQRANEGLARLSGYAADELAMLPLDTLFGSADGRSTMIEDVDQALRDFGAWSGERQLRRRDGRMRWTQISLRLVREDNPDAGVIASYVDVDDRHHAELAVAQQAERTRAILDSVLVGIVTVDDRGIEWMNRSARRMFGGELHTFVGQPISTVAPPGGDHPFRQTHYIDDLVEGRAETFECRVQARDGREFWVVGNAVATGGGSRGRQLTYALLDVERRRLAEARSAETQASLQRIIEAAPMAITLRDARTLRILQANEAAARSNQRRVADMIGTLPEALYLPDVAAEHRRDIETALATTDVTTREYRLAEGSDVRVWDARYLPLAAPGEPPDQLLMVATDVTEQRAAQEAKFEAALAQREMLVQEVHHRIKNNLQGVAGLLMQIAARKPEVASSISEVVGQVQAIAQVYGLQVGVTGPLRAKSVIEAITGSVRRTFGCTIDLSIEGLSPHRWALPEAESIPIALSINELLTNAVKHSSADVSAAHGDGVHCMLRCGDEAVSIVISNTGRLPPGFDLARFPGGVSGLGLIRALLPRRSAKLTIDQLGDRVVATIALAQPGVTKLAAA